MCTYFCILLSIVVEKMKYIGEKVYLYETIEQNGFLAVPIVVGALQNTVIFQDDSQVQSKAARTIYSANTPGSGI